MINVSADIIRYGLWVIEKKTSDDLNGPGLW